jgi:hypothetical protein
MTTIAQIGNVLEGCGFCVGFGVVDLGGVGVLWVGVVVVWVGVGLLTVGVVVAGGVVWVGVGVA